jgi:glutamyl-tRNA(Gln) amidotransferase subunit D
MRAKVFYENEVLEGVLMPDENKDTQFLKLKSGYNIGLSKKKIKKIVEIKEKPSKSSKKPIKANPNLPEIAVLHTGGTIASKVDYETGGVKAHFSAEELLSMFPELSKIANIKTVFVSNMMSEDMRFSHYQDLVKAIKKEMNNVKGIIIGHGTDTLAVTAAALSFMIENPPIPIMLVGSQRSSDRGSSDAGLNLICAAEFIASTNFKGVAICMHEDTSDNSCLIMPATKTRKMHTSRRDAFQVINDLPIARVDYEKKEIEQFKEGTEGKLSIKPDMEEKVAIIRTHPNMSVDFLKVLNEKSYKGLVLEGTGIGQAPTNIEKNIPIYNELKKFIKNGGVVVLTSQCIYGCVHPEIYANCRRLVEIGVVFGEDMLTETAHVKLAWLLANHPKQAKELIAKNLRGEITERSVP